MGGRGLAKRNLLKHGWRREKAAQHFGPSRERPRLGLSKSAVKSFLNLRPAYLFPMLPCPTAPAWGRLQVSPSAAARMVVLGPVSNRLRWAPVRVIPPFRNSAARAVSYPRKSGRQGFHTGPSAAFSLREMLRAWGDGEGVSWGRSGALRGLPVNCCARLRSLEA